VNHIKRTISIVAALLVCASFAVAESVWTDYDSAHPLLVRYMGAEETATIQVTSMSVIQITDTTTTTTTYNAITLAALKAAITAAKDDEDDMEWECIVWAGLDADSLANDDFVAAAANAVGKEWNTSVTEDTSAVKFYNLVPQPYPFGNYAGRGVGNSGGYTITDIIGEPAGTGDATVSVYVDGETRLFYQTIERPKYINSATYTTLTANNIVDLGLNIDVGKGVKVGSSKIGLIRVQRETTATIGASVSRP